MDGELKYIEPEYKNKYKKRLWKMVDIETKIFI